MHTLKNDTMKSAGKKLLTVFTIALLSQSISVGITAKASEKADLQNAKSKLDKGDYKQALKLYDELLQQGVNTAEVYLSLIHI